MKYDYDDPIGSWLQEHRQEMIDDICRLIRIDSELQPAAEGCPYGKGPAEVLAEAAYMLQNYGFQVTNYANHVITADFNQNPKRLDILAHLDVVPAGQGWTVTAAFEPLVREGRIYGRGSCDDKGPAVAAIYAMRAIHELGIPMRHNVRLILGANEECGSSDLQYYYQHEQEAPMTFSPDSDYPLINVEKGYLFGELAADYRIDMQGTRLLALQAGVKSNVVPAEAKALISGIGYEKTAEIAAAITEHTGVLFSISETRAEYASEMCPQLFAEDNKQGVSASETESEPDRSDDFVPDPSSDSVSMAKSDNCFTDVENNALLITAKGAAAHASRPDEGKNALTSLLLLLAKLPMIPESDTLKMLRSLIKLFPFGQHDGRSMGIQMSDEISGELTISLNLLQIANGRLTGMFDSRIPVCGNNDNVTAVIAEALEKEGIRLLTEKMVEPHHVPADSELVRILLESFEEYYQRPGEALYAGGCTYVHGLKRGVAFGCCLPETDNNMHGPDEFCEIDNMLLSARTFTDAILKICG